MTTSRRISRQITCPRRDSGSPPYRELAELVKLKELRGLRSRWQDRFGKPPEPVNNLLLTTEIKLAAAQAGISSVEITRPKAHADTKW